MNILDYFYNGNTIESIIEQELLSNEELNKVKYKCDFISKKIEDRQQIIEAYKEKIRESLKDK